MPLHRVTDTFSQLGLLFTVRAAVGVSLAGLILADDDIDMVDTKVIFLF
jgi:hypothetical protein